MNAQIKARIRPLMLPCLQGWQWFWDYVRARRRIVFGRVREKLLDFRYGRRALRQAVPVLQDTHGTRFVFYPDHLSLGRLVRRADDVSDFRAITRLLSPGSVAVDVGANVGIYSVLFSRLCGPEGRVWAFEPVPDTYWRLVETLALNRCENVVPVQAAICERIGPVRMNLFEREFAEWNTLGNPSMRLRNGSRVSPSSFVEVRGRTLDQFCAEERIERIHFLKVDVEGFEWAVFQGAETLLRDGRIDHICFEISQEPLKGAGVESRQVFEELETRGYFAYHFDCRSDSFRGPIRDTSEYWTNFFASRTDLTRLIEQAVPHLTATVKTS